MWQNLSGREIVLAGGTGDRTRTVAYDDARTFGSE
jgi:hypothetical protein